MSRADWSAATVLSLVELDVCWELLGLGETPWQLDLPSPGRTHGERRQIITHTLDGLRQRNLAGRSGPSPTLAVMLNTLANAAHHMDARIRYGALRAGIGAIHTDGAGVVAIRQGDEVGLLTVPATAVNAVLVDLVGPITPGVGLPVNLPADVLDAARAAAPTTGSAPQFADQLARLGIPAAEARSVVRMCTPVDQLGQFGVTVRTPAGQLRRGRRVLGLHHTPSGHYLQLRRRGQVTIAPLRRERLVELLDDLLAETAAAGR